ncbi:GlsB/YeaQ/YmgE family stress response membrane protein [Asticcacaulis sp. 201]|uniref:GlsB/YeaQ/YmgE family stress response membrane protein n=1 Tax=Asticcacaulis sp. 201 TaxID=3028787 RepID=UPI002917008F|nr:GlsB/YeaQ/YmgE family stress response membrane protein [Asticcacaulis sp. 201]MDV6332466.1 GlsB/YeaQ/YmgE family stress response membrane protein [Asticcacaulis sp. 201]
MEQQGIGWLLAIIVGAVAGWAAEQIMKSNQGLLMNIILGIVGSIVANALFSIIGISFGGVIGYLVAGIVGACILIAIGRMMRGRRV